MKDFIKWLGVNEKIAKVVVWLLIIMVFIIVFNTGLESTGFPYYKITYDNIIKINFNKVFEYVCSSIVSVLSFYSVVLLVFRVKETKRIFKYAILYLIINILLGGHISEALIQIFIFMYIVVFCYLYSKKNWKYILYSIVSYMIVVIVQGVWYLSKARFIDYSKLNETTQSFLSIDYFIIMFIIILVKEIYLKKRGEK